MRKVWQEGLPIIWNVFVDLQVVVIKIYHIILAYMVGINLIVPPCHRNMRTLPSPTDSMWSPGQSPESMWTLDIFFLVVAQPIFCLESMWSSYGVQLDSSYSIWTAWTPPRNRGNMNAPSKTPYGVHMDQLSYIIYHIK